MKFKDLKIGQKLFAGFGIILALTIVVAFVGWNSLSGVAVRAENLKDANDMINAVNAVKLDEREFIITKEKELVENVKKKLDQLEKIALAAKERLQDQYNRDQMDAVALASRNYLTAFNSYLGQEDKKAVDLETMRTEARDVQKLGESLSDGQDQLLADVAKRSSNATQLMEIVEKSRDASYILELFVNARMNEKEVIISSGEEKYLKLQKDYFDKALSLATDLTAHFTNDRNIQQGEQLVDALKKYDEAYTLYVKDMHDQKPITAELEKVSSEAITQIRAALDDQQKKMNSQVASSTVMMIMFAMLAIVLGVIIAFIITNMISSPVIKGVGFARSLSEGNLEAQLDVDQKDEIGDLARALQGMRDKLVEIVSSITSTSNYIVDASNEISTNSQQMSQGAANQASSAEEVSSSMEEMAANIQQNTDNAQQTEKIAILAADRIKDSNISSKTAEKAMTQIADKIKIVNDIAFQTNILALNAAVEAARAGEHGKGFAVVAAEVRKLAERSKIAADEINELSKNGVEVSIRAGKQMEDLVPEIEKTARLVQEISVSSIEQNSGAAQVNEALQSLNRITQQNAAASEELATSAEEMSSQAVQMQDLMSFFKLAKSDHNSNYGFVSKKTKSPIHNTQQFVKKTNAKSNQPKTNSASGANLNMGDDQFETF